MTFFKGMNVLVTGGAGFVGTNLTKRLLDEGVELRATLHEKEAQINDDRVEYIKCDLTSREDCYRACKGMDYVFICSAVTSGASVIQHTPLAHLTPNLIMNALMLEAAHASGVRKTLFISSNTVYPLTNYPVSEEDVTNEFYHKYHIVAWMKRFSELMCDMYSTRIDNPMQTAVVRPANIYGPYDDFQWETSHVLPAFIRKVVERNQPIKVWGDGSDIKDFIYIDDFIDGLLLAMMRLQDGEPINIASGKQACLRDVLKMIIELDGYSEAKVEYDKSKPTMIPVRLINAEKAKVKLGFSAKISIEEGLGKTIEWYRKSCG